MLPCPAPLLAWKLHPMLKNSKCLKHLEGQSCYIPLKVHIRLHAHKIMIVFVFLCKRKWLNQSCTLLILPEPLQYPLVFCCVTMLSRHLSTCCCRRESPVGSILQSGWVGRRRPEIKSHHSAAAVFILCPKWPSGHHPQWTWRYGCRRERCRRNPRRSHSLYVPYDVMFQIDLTMIYVVEPIRIIYETDVYLSR